MKVIPESAIDAMADELRRWWCGESGDAGGVLAILQRHLTEVPEATGELTEEQIAFLSAPTIGNLVSCSDVRKRAKNLTVVFPPVRDLDAELLEAIKACCKTGKDIVNCSSHKWSIQIDDTTWRFSDPKELIAWIRRLTKQPKPMSKKPNGEVEQLQKELADFHALARKSYSGLEKATEENARLRRELAAAKEDVEAMAAIKELRNDKGSYIIIPCDNPDFSGPKWTRYREQNFFGDSLLECLRKALKMKHEALAAKKGA
ncbi:hypothetical protein M0R72_10150 [Candidatus Pacearchaeota archaeon]|jgi:hypothetical protein|nr:hypothetical protein [Candidatus Pacearchaeota archaeon]